MQVGPKALRTEEPFGNAQPCNLLPKNTVNPTKFVA